MTGTPDPFTALGLPVRPDLSDEQVRAAWRQVAAATHPDRPDGGDPAVSRRSG
jgi:curved DNA-binding protein CbpA